ncbi:MAG: ABC transporter permease [Candidatus Marinimicrobia bacterium]|nr:ABC transporter permease [Candidatus Neomarinimicrobiota bacterium]
MSRHGHYLYTMRESLRMALEAIRENKLRASLTLLGIIIGMFSFIGANTAILTLESSINKGLSIFGSNTFLIQKYPLIQMGGHTRHKYRNRRNITYRQYEELKERAQLPVMVSVIDGTGGKSIKYKDRQAKISASVNGGDEGAMRSLKTYIADGRDLTRQDVDFSRNVVILGMDIVDQLFPFEDPLGKYITVNGLKYRVIGITERQGNLFGQSQDDFILIPISNYLRQFSNRWTSLSITIEAESVELYDKTKDEVVGIMRTIRKVDPGDDNDFEVASNDELIDTFAQFTSGFKLFAFAISIIALAVAGIGIMNIMLVSVSDRIKEIGIRKAVGANRRDILTQFLTEAVFLSMFGGIIGVILGVVVGGNAVAMIFNIPAVIPIDWVFYGLLVCSMIGIGFGSYPAYRAAKLDPIESLHYE